MCAEEEEGECAFDIDASVDGEDAVVVFVVAALAGGTADIAAVREGRRLRAEARSIADFGDAAADDDDGCRRRGAVSLVATTRACWRPAASGIETRISIGFGELSLLSSR